MSSPILVHCECGYDFYMFEKTQSCPKCKDMYISHRASKQEREKAFEKQKIKDCKKHK